MNEKHDVFVGNLTFNTTEQQLHDIFSFVGPVKNIRILQDKDTGRPKGFAFIEYMDANTALAAIRRLDGTELNGRKLRVSYSNNSKLKELAKTIGQEVIESEPTLRQETQTVLNLKLSEGWDLLEIVKYMSEEGNGDKARFLFENYPQLVPALLQLQKRLGIVSSASGASAAESAMYSNQDYYDDMQGGGGGGGSSSYYGSDGPGMDMSIYGPGGGGMSGGSDMMPPANFDLNEQQWDAPPMYGQQQQPPRQPQYHHQQQQQQHHQQQYDSYQQYN